MATASDTARRAPALPPDERRQAIVEATLGVLLAKGAMATTREIAAAAGIAEGTIFRAFADKDELLDAVIEQAHDIAPLEGALGALDPDLGYDAALEAVIVILQQRVIDVWRVTSAIGSRPHHAAPKTVADSPALVALLTRHADRLRVEPVVAARLLRALTLAATHPVLVAEAMSPAEIADLFLHGTLAREAGT